MVRVLIVDGCADAGESLAILLRLWGHEVYLACDGPTALEVVRTYRPDVVLSEIALEGMDGCKLARHLRNLEGMEKVRLVAITGYGRDADRRRCCEAGFDLHLVKPADPDFLRALLTSPCPVGRDVAGERGASTP